MPNHWTLEEIRTSLATESGLVGSDYHQKTALDLVIRRAIERVWDYLTDDNVGFGRVRTILVTTPNEEKLLLPADHKDTRMLLRARSGTAQNDGQPASRTTEELYVREYGLETFDTPARPGLYWYFDENTIVLRPTPVEAEEIVFLYIKNAPRLVNDTDQINLPNGAIQGLIDLAAALILRDPQERQEKAARGEKALVEIVARRGQRRDRDPDWGGNYRRDRSFGGFGISR